MMSNGISTLCNTTNKSVRPESNKIKSTKIESAEKSTY